ncbi:MAG: hypothetical protein FWF50_04140 [Defluviitaleaceae bacterium]|nr:hypothetical protein [Defluviitaleaceae bacterium]
MGFIAGYMREYLRDEYGEFVYDSDGNSLFEYVYDIYIYIDEDGIEHERELCLGNVYVPRKRLTIDLRQRTIDEIINYLNLRYVQGLSSRYLDE